MLTWSKYQYIKVQLPNKLDCSYCSFSFVPGRTPRSTSNPNCEVGMIRCIDEYFLHHVTQRISQRFCCQICQFSPPRFIQCGPPRASHSQCSDHCQEPFTASWSWSVSRPSGTTNAARHGHRSVLWSTEFHCHFCEVIVLRHMNFPGKIPLCEHACHNYHRRICF
jgi:hypothetical protein